MVKDITKQAILLSASAMIAFVALVCSTWFSIWPNVVTHSSLTFYNMDFGVSEIHAVSTAEGEFLIKSENNPIAAVL